MTTQIPDEFIDFIRKTIFELKDLLSSIAQHNQKLYTFLALRFLISLTNLTVRLVEDEVPGSKPHLFSMLRETMVLGESDCFTGIVSSTQGELYTAKGINEHDKQKAVQFIGQELSISLLKALYKLPESLHTSEVITGAIEAMLKIFLEGNSATNTYQMLYLLSERLHKVMNDMNLPTKH